MDDASIHAPARGATLGPSGCTVACGLQSTLPHGERRLPWMYTKLAFGLQSTLPHGERPSSHTLHAISPMLQSTLPHGERRLSQTV